MFGKGKRSGWRITTKAATLVIKLTLTAEDIVHIAELVRDELDKAETQEERERIFLAAAMKHKMSKNREE